MRLPLFQVDAFADAVFGGNPAAVVPMAEWPDDDAVLHAIAAENNLSETAFIVGDDGRYAIRWFTPRVEVALCGHATLASAWVVMEKIERACDEVIFDSRSGPLTVARVQGGGLSMDFPAQPSKPVAVMDGLERALGARIMEMARAGEQVVAVLDSPATVRDLQPDLSFIVRFVEARGLIVTAEGGVEDGDGIDFVSRYFAPRAGVAEDPVTGSAHCALAPFWAPRLGRNAFAARQLSRRGGTVRCALSDDGTRVELVGQCVPYLEGTIDIPA